MMHLAKGASRLLVPKNIKTAQTTIYFRSKPIVAWTCPNASWSLDLRLQWLLSFSLRSCRYCLTMLIVLMWLLPAERKNIF